METLPAAAVAPPPQPTDCLSISLSPSDCSAYLLQDWSMSAFPSWLDAGVVTMWAAWAAALLSLAGIVGLACLVSLPFYFAVERPVAQLWPRTW